jgi:thiamine kinase-like enzyme|tara:strand:- start:2891 stop:3919 length:1029 start_codon:yes stop_codon:yes gene_type:complete
VERAEKNSVIEVESDTFLLIRGFVERNGIIPIDHIRKVKEGRNSQVYFVEQGRRKWVVKEYFRHDNDTRNRLNTEFCFLTFLTENEVEQVGKPIASDVANNLGLFSHLPGSVPKTINRNLINQAGEFVKKINEVQNTELAKRLPEASEACFSIMDHIDCVKKRVKKLSDILPMNAIQHDVSAFIYSSLLPALNKVSNNIKKTYSDEKLQHALPNHSRILSPSDFGFQNTLIYKSILYFLDFEYAGWDDPAKLFCDFGCHPEIPVTNEYFQIFKHSFSSWLPDYDESITRSEMLMPLYRLKWCCIMLNEFTLAGRARRNHAGKVFDYEHQFQKTKKYYNKYLA